MATVLDVARYILDKQGSMTAMKLQKLTYYSKAWHLVWEEQSLFPDRIEAWANGPVSPLLYSAHRGKFRVEPAEIQGNTEALTDVEKESIDSVLGFYGEMRAMELSELTHREDPWKCTRDGLPMGASSNAVITEATLAEYYGALV